MIALFDSGLGGLTVLAEVRRLLPLHDLLYFADSAYCPYGPRPAEWVRARSLVIGQTLVAAGAQLLVVACNTATAAGLEPLRRALPVPVVGMEPGVKPAVAATRSGVVGVLATSATARSDRLAALVERFAHGVTVLTQPCPGLADQIEHGDLEGPETRELLVAYLTPLLERGADTIVLACTHYPLIITLIRELTGPGVTLIDTGPAVARHVAAQAAARGIGPGSASLGYASSGDPALLLALLARLGLADDARLLPYLQQRLAPGSG